MRARGAWRYALPVLAGGLVLLWFYRVPSGTELTAQSTPSAVLPPGEGARVATQYRITAQAGEWLVCAASYVGEDAPELAGQMVLYLRQQHRLPAFVLDRGEQARQQQLTELPGRLNPDGTVQRRRLVRVQEQCAVLIGGFRGAEDAHAALAKVKRLPPPKLQAGQGRLEADMLTEYGVGEGNQPVALRRAPVNPFASSFVVRNPAIQHAPVKKQEFDPFWKELNSGEAYSLLKNGRPWTLVVKVYQGAAVLKPQSTAGAFLDKLGIGQSRDLLNASALQAHELARWLRQYNFEAWVLHTRSSSIVTVGGFENPGDQRLQQIQRQLATLHLRPQGGVGAPQMTDQLALMSPPMPMQVPRP
jgi:hypothetical protein